MPALIPTFDVKLGVWSEKQDLPGESAHTEQPWLILIVRLKQNLLSGTSITSIASSHGAQSRANVEFALNDSTLRGPTKGMKNYFSSCLENSLSFSTYSLYNGTKIYSLALISGLIDHSLCHKPFWVTVSWLIRTLGSSKHSATFVVYLTSD